MSEPGHNNPPDMTATAGETAKDLSGWMADNPVIETEEQAREAKVFVDRGILCVKDLEDERKGKTAPLNEQVKTINDYYRAPRELIQGVVDELKSRCDSFLLREEAKRQAIAAEAARVAEEAERNAREAERLEREAIDDANAGVVGLDIADVTTRANDAFAGFEKAARAAALAERETKVKIGGGFTRALGLRSREILYVYNAETAVAVLGATTDITEAILRSARAYRKIHNELPMGVSADIERKS